MNGVPSGGLEHRASTTLMWNRFKFRPRENYEDFLALASHEMFHTWNGKRIRPRELGPFAYNAENYTRFLVVGRRPIKVDPRISAKTSLIVAVPHEEGALLG